MDPAATDWEVLNAKLVARILHDVAGPTSGLASAIDLMDGEEALRRDAAVLARESLARMADKIAFCRAAFGGGHPDAAALEDLARRPFAAGRARLSTFSAPEPLSAPAARACLVMAQILAEALAGGGEASILVEIAGETCRVTGRGEGSKILIPAETHAGLSGQPHTSGLAGRWAPARYLHALADSRGGTLAARVEATPPSVSLAWSVPALSA